MDKFIDCLFAAFLVTCLAALWFLMIGFGLFGLHMWGKV